MWIYKMNLWLADQILNDLKLFYRHFYELYRYAANRLLSY